MVTKKVNLQYYKITVNNCKASKRPHSNWTVVLPNHTKRYTKRISKGFSFKSGVICKVFAYGDVGGS